MWNCGLFSAFLFPYLDTEFNALRNRYLWGIFHRGEITVSRHEDVIAQIRCVRLIVEFLPWCPLTGNRIR